jgi:hypothetical protein
MFGSTRPREGFSVAIRSGLQYSSGRYGNRKRPGQSVVWSAVEVAGGDCKPVGVRLRRFKSVPAHVDVITFDVVSSSRLGVTALRLAWRTYGADESPFRSRRGRRRAPAAVPVACLSIAAQPHSRSQRQAFVATDTVCRRSLAIPGRSPPRHRQTYLGSPGGK